MLGPFDGASSGIGGSVFRAVRIRDEGVLCVRLMQCTRASREKMHKPEIGCEAVAWWAKGRRRAGRVIGCFTSSPMNQTPDQNQECWARLPVIIATSIILIAC